MAMCKSVRVINSTMSVGPVSVVLFGFFVLTAGDPLRFIRDSGTAKNCGSVPFNLTWTPKKINPSGPVTVYIDYTSPHDFHGGFINTSVYFHGDKEPFFSYYNKTDCFDVNRFFPFKICPLKKGQRVTTHRTFKDAHQLRPFPGTYDAVARWTNKKGQEMMCVKITLTILMGDSALAPATKIFDVDRPVPS